ncbi:MAG TPA: keywimysin-related RiPP [Jatrophihabitantaceae bacterium]|jgi:hypothetical protein|nr:keywimysin-related RiPP [Jatrophihabitantaceae bacterium]
MKVYQTPRIDRLGSFRRMTMGGYDTNTYDWAFGWYN